VQSPEERFLALMREVGEPLRRYVVRRVPADQVDDVLSDVFLVVWRRLDEVPADEALPWCYGVGHLCVANARRSERRRLQLVDKLGQQPVAPAPEVDPALAEALDQLSETDRELVRLWAWERLQPVEIGAVVGMSANAVSLRLSRARKKLHDLLRQDRVGAGQKQGESRRGGDGDA
jgi:RNA polymerase sigma-70 factor (ECF subfamily)